MAARTKTKVTPKYKTKYRVKNWAAYDIALRERGDITVWFDEESIFAWNASPSGRPGGQRRYSDLAIVTALTLRTVFHLPLRQTEGFVASLIGLLGLTLNAPDHTTLSRRNRDVEVPRLPRGQDGPLHLVIDSTGLKIFGDGEWQAHKHGTLSLRRSWRKLHLGIDGDGYIIAAALTDRGVDDASVWHFDARAHRRHDRAVHRRRSLRYATNVRGAVRSRRWQHQDCDPAEEDGQHGFASHGTLVPTQRSDREDRCNWPTSLAERVRRSPPGSRRGMGCTDTNALLGIVSELSIAKPKRRRR